MVASAAPVPLGTTGTAEGSGLTEDQKVVLEANERYQACKDWQGTEDERAREDTKFANGDARNTWQWPNKIYEDRTSGGTDLPCLTINNTRVHNDLIINDICKQDFGIKIRPVGGKASYKSAQMMEALIRRIQDQSTFSAQRRKVAEQQVDGGIGHMLMETRFVSERSFDQDIYLKAARDSTCVYEDPWIREPDGSDKNFKLEFERLPRKEFNRKYPKYADKVGQAPVNSAFSDWFSDKEIMLVRYWRKKAVADVLISYKDDNGDEVEKLKSEIVKEAGQEIFDALWDEIQSGDRVGRKRTTTNNDVEWFLIAGDQIVERGKWAGKYVPGARCVGRELVIDNTLDRKGHTRPMIDAQRMLNFNASSSVQYIYSQTKTNWIAPARAIEGQEQWKSANVDNYAVLVYSDVDDEASSPELAKVDAPQRIEPPKPSPAYATGMQDAERQMMMISGQFQAQMGENDNQSANSGKAINARKQQSDTATYHFFEHQSDMLRLLGKQLLDLIPKIYDTERALQVIGEKGEKIWIRIDPHQDEVIREMQAEAEDEEAVKLAFNPNLGQYECISDPGPDYATQRQEAWNALSLILQQSKELAASAGDLLFKYGDFPGAQEIMERLQKEIKATKPYLFDDGPTPAMAEIQAQMQKLTAINAELVQKLATQEIKHKGYQEKRDVDAQNADTARLKVTVEALSKLLLTPAQHAQLLHEVEQGARQHVFNLIEGANEASLASENDNADESASA